MPPPPQTPPQGVGGLGANSALGSMLADLPAHLTPGWQGLDLAVKALRTAMRSVDFQKTPAIVAVVQSVTNTLTELMASRTAGTSGGSNVPSQAGGPSSDADSQPSAPDEDAGGGDES